MDTFAGPAGGKKLVRRGRYDRVLAAANETHSVIITGAVGMYAEVLPKVAGKKGIGALGSGRAIIDGDVARSPRFALRSSG
jgi:hypothetical protein